MRIIAALLLLAATDPGHASIPDSSRFQAFAERLVGRWDVTIREVDETGKLMFEEHQTHVFSHGIGAQFLEERAMTEGNAHSSTGLVVLSYDTKTNVLSQHAFFGFQP